MPLMLSNGISVEILTSLPEPHQRPGPQEAPGADIRDAVQKGPLFFP